MSAETVAATNALGHFLAGLSNQPARPLADIRLRKAAYAIDRLGDLRRARRVLAPLSNAPGA